MKKNAINIIIEFLCSAGSNFIGALISAALVVIVPKFLPEDQYGYWQMGIFYLSYVGFFHFGWGDGIYLRYGGAHYSQLNKGLFKSQIATFLCADVCVGVLIGLAAMCLPVAGYKKYIFMTCGICCITQLPGSVLRLLLQATGRIKEYSFNILLDKVSYAIILLGMLILGIKDYRILLIAYLASLGLASACAIYYCRDLIFNREHCSLAENWHETKSNICAGSKLLVANLTSMLIIGVVRLGIEHAWDVTTFGKVSLTLNISNVAMIFVSAISMITFPILKRTEEKNWVSIYNTMSTIMMAPIVCLLLFYFPIYWILIKWLPGYADSLKFMAILFPMCLYEGKMQLLINTYLKALRKEKILLYVNILAVAVSGMLTIIFTVITQHLMLAVLGIVIVMAFRCILSEILLSRYISIAPTKEIILELVCSVIFIISSYFIPSKGIGFLACLTTYALYLIMKRRELKASFKMIKSLFG